MACRLQQKAVASLSTICLSIILLWQTPCMLHDTSPVPAMLATHAILSTRTLTNLTYPIHVTQNYYDQSQAPPPPSNTSVTIETLSFSGFAGTINSQNPGRTFRTSAIHPLTISLTYAGGHSCISDPCWYYVSGVDGTQSIIFNRLYANTVTSIHAKDILVAPQVPKLPTVICNETVVKGLDIRFKCWGGLYEATLSGIFMFSKESSYNSVHP